MFQPPHETTNTSNPEIGDTRYPPQSAHAQNQASHGVSNFVDGSGPIFSMYMEMATEEDKKMAENWKADADGILIFTGLFSAAVATLISVTIQDIRPNPQDTSNFYLANIYQTVADPNRSNISSSLPPSPPPFSPPNYAIWVNALWFLSLVVSLTCALLATLLQQWARRYLRVTQSRFAPHKRARIRAFFFEGDEKFLLPWVVETLPALLHISLFLFFAGLIVFLCNVNMTILKLVSSWVGVCTALYGCITVMPILRHDSPYYTSLSSSAWLIVIGIRYVVFQFFLSFYASVHLRRPVFRRFRDRYYKSLLQGMQRTVEETALKFRSGIDARAFMWTFDSLDEDHELERFFSGLPGFRSSKVIDDPLPFLTEEQKWKLSRALIGLLDRTFSSDLLPGTVKEWRAMICAKATDPVHTPLAHYVLTRISPDHLDSGPAVGELLVIVRLYDNGSGENTVLVARATTSHIVAKARQRDDAWFILASNGLGIPVSVLRDYAAHGNNLSLAILIHIARQQFTLFSKDFSVQYWFEFVLKAASEFNVQDTSPELQHEFCALWNQIVRKAQNDNDLRTAGHLLRPIRNIYVTLHQDTDSAPTHFSPYTDPWDGILWEPSSYPVCNVAGHIHDDSASTAPHHIIAPIPYSLPSLYPPSSSTPASLHVDENPTPHIHDVPASTSVFHPNAPLILPSLVGPDRLPSSILTPLRVDETPTDVHLLDDNPSVPASFHPTRQTATENLHIPAASPDPTAAGETQDISTSANTIPPTTFILSASPVPLNDAVDLQQRAGLLASSAPDFQLSTSPNPVLDTILSTESHHSILGTTAPGTSLGPSFAPDLGATAEDEGSQMADLRTERGTLDTSVNREVHANTIATLNPPLRSPLLSSVPDATMVGPPRREPDAGHIGDQPSLSSQGQSDLV